nr:DSD1 family PLP-dependent enzyme [Actinomycetales bacterium]
GVPLRLHVKTAKAVEVATRAYGGGTGPITVSTLAEAERFADDGWTDVLYAVGIDPHKLPRVRALVDRGVAMTVLLDSLAQAEALAAFCGEAGVVIPALVEIDCDGHRGGVLPGDPALVEIGRVLDHAGLLGGVLAHAGESYFATTRDAQAVAAENERAALVAAAGALRAAGLPCPVVSAGSTPTAHAARNLEGITEVRAGNFVFFDLVMAGIGVCSVADLALSVVVTVIGHRPEKGWIITDGGWMSTSRDRGTARQAVDQGYGLVADLDGVLIPGLLMTDASQEHGTISRAPGDSRPLPDLPVGTRLRILPNHACATAAQHERYHVVRGADPGDPTGVVAVWGRQNGW